MNAIAFHPNFSVLATGSDDASIRLWEVETGDHTKSLKGHLKGVTGLCFARDGNYLISCSADFSIKIWNSEADYCCIKTMHGHDNTISSLCIIPDLDMIASVSRDQTVKLWDLASGYCNATLSGHSDWIKEVACSENGTLLATAGSDKVVLIWELTSKSLKGELRGHTNAIESILFLPISSNKRIHTLLGKNGTSSNVEFLVTASRDKLIKIWSLSQMNCVKTFVIFM